MRIKIFIQLPLGDFSWLLSRSPVRREKEVLTNEASVQQVIEQTIASFDKIDVVVNNAGYALVGSFEKLTDQEIRQNFDVNVFGTLNVIRKVMPHLRKQESGHIFNIASIAGQSFQYDLQNWLEG